MTHLNYKFIVAAAALLLASLATLIVWLSPISGQVIVSPASAASTAAWPRVVAQPARPQPGDTVTLSITDQQPWAHVRLTVDGQAATFVDWETQTGVPMTTWTWTMQLPETLSSRLEVAFYSDCHTGCRQRGRSYLLANASTQPAQDLPEQAYDPTKLCVVFANPARDWHGRSGWVVDLTYAQWADSEEDTYWTVDELAERVYAATQKGLKVLVRVDYDKGQSLPPAGDLLALDEYLAFVQRLARDERLRDVYGYIIGSGYNAIDSSSLAPQTPTTPEWYARVFNGYGEPVARVDNVVQTVRAENPAVRVIVGPLRPWSDDQSGRSPYAIDAPWLSYMNTLVELLAESATAEALQGNPRAAPDGFALNAPGRVEAGAGVEDDAAQEPRTDFARADQGGAQFGFRVYQDFLFVINSSPVLRGLPVYISTTNTFTPDRGVPPAQNYPAGWLTNALAEVNAEPQIQTLCWFLDLVPGDDQWDAFSLTRQPGKMQDASEEFDSLLRGEAERAD